MQKSKEKLFQKYAESFLTGDLEFDRNIHLKLAHSFRVQLLANKIAVCDLADLAVRNLVDYAALYHDLGRFEQLRQYRTFCDAESIDHGDLSALLLEKLELLNHLSPADRETVTLAVRSHNKLTIPSDFTNLQTVVTQVVRDADKIDIIPILLDYLAQPDNDSVVYHLKSAAEFSPAVAEALRAQRCPSHADLKNLNDFIGGKIAWVYDLNFPAARAEFLHRRYLEKLRVFLPDNEQVNSLVDQAFVYLRNGI